MKTRRFLIPLLLALIFSFAPDALAQDRAGDDGRLQKSVENILERLNRTRLPVSKENEFTELVRARESMEDLVEDDALDEGHYREAERVLRRMYIRLGDVREQLDDDGEDALAGEIGDIEEAVEEALDLARELALADENREADDVTTEEVEADEDISNSDEWKEEEEDTDDRANGREPREWWKRDRAFRHDRSFSAVGDYGFDWPFQQTAVYRTIPPVRYNRVEGFVLGISSEPLAFDDYERIKAVGQVGYAFALEKIRYEAGAELRLTGRLQEEFGLKIGGNYHSNTATNDVWKSTWVENGLAAFLFSNDFFDYYETQGWTLYAVQRLSEYGQVSAGYRSDRYRGLSKSTTWSLFGGSGFRQNPSIDEGDINSFVAAIEGGKVAGLSDYPRGAAFRLEMETSNGLDSDYEFTRFEADGRAYVPVSVNSSLALRLRLGTSNGTVPYQKGFTIGGIGTVRGIPQNAFFGTRMAVANAEYIFGGLRILDDALEDIQFLLLADAGWVNNDGVDAFDWDNVMPSAGIGLGFNDRTVRLELAFPLRDAGFGTSPSLWLRLSPSF